MGLAETVDENDAITFLNKHKWNITSAADELIENPFILQRINFSRSSVTEFFNQYKDPESNQITEDGYDRLMADLEIAEDDIVQFVIAWKCDCSRLSEFTAREFERGMVKLQCDSLEKLKSQLPALRNEIKPPASFREFYNFMFLYSKASEDKKGIPKDLAIFLWDMLLPAHFPLLKEWKAFIANYKRDISKDTWQLLLDFARTCAEDPKLGKYDANAAWPTLIDEFVAWLVDNGKIPPRPI